MQNRSWMLLALLGSSACTMPVAGENEAVDPHLDPLGASVPWCAGKYHGTSPSGVWRHSFNADLSLDSPHHTAQDVVGVLGAPVTIRGKFTYGELKKDLEDEIVDVWIGDCSGWRMTQALTDGDGRIALTTDPGLPAGVYDLSLEVDGDDSVARAKLWLLPAGTHVVVTDVDGTLTTSDGELFADIVADFFEPIFRGDYVPQAYPGGPELLRAHADHGAILVYLTGRPHGLTDSTRDWLRDLGFPPGIVHTTDYGHESSPSDEGVGTFKYRYLRSLREAGLVLDLAYGNASTDIHGYAAAGIPATSTWIIGAHAGDEGTNAVKDTWMPRAEEVRAQPDVIQPFGR